MQILNENERLAQILNILDKIFRLTKVVQDGRIFRPLDTLGDVSLYSLGSLQHHIAADKLAKTKNPLVVISTLLNEIAKRKAEYGFFDSVVTEGNQTVKLFEQSLKAHFPNSQPQDLVVFHHQ